jgi:arginyl-tRNA synthetase
VPQVTPADLSSQILHILAALQSEGKLSALELPAEVVVERPKNRDHGDWATNVAMQFAPKFG